MGSDDRTDPNLPAPPRQRPELKALGPLEPLMRDPTITEVMVNDVRNVIVERDGKLMLTGVSFRDAAEVERLAREILRAAGVTLEAGRPFADAMLPDGSRINVIAPPLTLGGPCITIRKFPQKRYSAQDLLAAGLMDQRIAYFLNACVLGRVNVLVSGGTGAGKTTLLNALIGFIPPAERVLTIEDAAELSIEHPNSVRMQTMPRPPGGEPVSARDLVVNSLRMRPDRVVVGECRRAEAFDVIQAMNTGHEGSMTTVHGNSPRDALSRLETLFMMAGVDLPLPVVRRQISEALDLLVHLKRQRDGSRRIVCVSEVTGMEGDVVTLQDVFVHDEKGFRPTGLVPTFVARLRDRGVELPHGFFG